MGFRYRKSINLGGGFRINLSKSGIGYSWGTKGMRFTKKASGGTRSTFSIPGTGISHVSDSKKSTSSRHKTSGRQTSSQISYGEEHSTNVLKIDEVSSNEYSEFLSLINKTLRVDLISVICLWSTILAFAYPPFLLVTLVGLGLKVFAITQMKIVVDYEFNDDARLNYESAYDAWMQITKCKKVWQKLTAKSIQNSKVAGGARSAIKRKTIKVLDKAPYYLNINMQPFGLKLKGSKLYFLPDKLLVIKGYRAGAVDYDDLNIIIGTTTFLEESIVPRDAKVIGKRWLKVNKNGTPDKRYKDNRQIPICEYGEIRITSGQSLDFSIMFSNCDILPQIKENIVLLGEF